MRTKYHARIVIGLAVAAMAIAVQGCGEIPKVQTGAQKASVSSRVLVQFDPAGKASVTAAVQALGGKIHYVFDRLNTLATTLPSQAVDVLRANTSVLLVEEDAKRYRSSETVPYGMVATQADQLWSSGTGDSSVVVCIIDSGLWTGHADFAGLNVQQGYPSDWSTDTCGHGTHVAGTVAAQHGNNLGVVGAAPGVTLKSIKVFGGANCAWVYASDLVHAANKCAESKVAGTNVIISMSLGGDFSSRFEQAGFDDLEAMGILSIAAAGNDGNKRKSYPASYASVVSVAAVEPDGNGGYVHAAFSQENNAVEVAAPGVGVVSTVPFRAGVTVAGVEYAASLIENAATGTATGALVDGGLCNATGPWAGKVVLCERGDISFFDKVMNVQASGGVAALIYNNAPGGFAGTLGEATSTIPAFSMTQEDGQYLVANQLGASATASYEAPGSGYEAWDGTSMATPHVSGVAALIWSQNPGASAGEVRTALTATALDLGDPGKDNKTGFGLIQGQAAADYLASGGQCSEGSSCDDGDACTSGDTCSGGTCSGTPITACVHGDGCCPSVCDSSNDDDCGGGGGTCTLGGQKGDPCSSGSDCCSGTCAGKPGAQTCK